MQKPSERLKKKIEKENLWLFILSLLQHKGKKSGSELRSLITERFGFVYGNVTAYKVLYLLKRSGYVKPQKKGKFVYYTITAQGKEELEAAKKVLEFYISKI
ncbi:MAG: PadR family transcriptional regulator [Candidatus Diapherotrites archaeon]|nr:PadR family transcriptional regulator [Candidatus Diapherotrites archaeon]